MRCRKMKLATGGYNSSPNTVCVTALPCKILITTLLMGDAIILSLMCSDTLEAWWNLYYLYL